MSRQVEIVLDHLKASGYLHCQPGEHAGRAYTAIEPLPARVTRCAATYIPTIKALAHGLREWKDVDLGAAMTVHCMRARYPEKTSKEAALIAHQMKPGTTPARMDDLAARLDAVLANARERTLAEACAEACVGGLCGRKGMTLRIAPGPNCPRVMGVPMDGRFVAYLIVAARHAARSRGWRNSPASAFRPSRT